MRTVFLERIGRCNWHMGAFREGIAQKLALCGLRPSSHQLRSKTLSPGAREPFGLTKMRLAVMAPVVWRRKG